MTRDHVTTSAAVYFAVTPNAPIPLQMLGQIQELSKECDLSPILFTAFGGDFLLDDCYVFAEAGGDLTMWGERLVARRADLIDALSRRCVEYVGFDSPRSGSRDRSDWRGHLSISSDRGVFYVGLDENLVGGTPALLERAVEMIGDLFPIRYGIAYKMALSQEPDCYAKGFEKTSLAEVREFIRNRDTWDQRKKTPDELWRNELIGPRRHLTGLFRGAYPASVLSDAHVRAANLTSQRVGRLEKLCHGLWLWELSDAEIPAAEAMLESKRLLVRQAPTVQ